MTPIKEKFWQKLGLFICWPAIAPVLILLVACYILMAWPLIFVAEIGKKEEE